MQRGLILSALILSSALSANAMADDSTAGALVGGGIGAIVGHAMGGRNGALVGGVLGAVVGSSVANDNRSYRHGDQTYYHDNNGGYDNSYAVSYSQPAPVYVAPAPEPYYRPAPVYVSQPVYTPVRYVRDDRDGWRREHEWREHDGRDWRERDGRDWHEHDGGDRDHEHYHD